MSDCYGIVVPLYNDEVHFNKLLQSLIDCGIDPSKIVVVLSGHKGNIVELSLVHGFQIIYSEEKLSPGDARNIGAKQVRKSYVVFLDSDIVVTLSWKQALDEITKQGKIKLAGDTYHISTAPHWIEDAWFSEIRELERTYLNGGNIIIDKKLFEELNGFDPSLETGEDYDLSMRAAKLGHKPVFDRRLIVHHEGNPKSIRSFMKREKWHATGDLVSVGAVFRSKVMLASVVYSLILLTAFACLLTGLIKTFFVLLFFLLVFSATLTIYKLGWNSRKFVKCTAVMNFYLIGRGWALTEKLSRLPKLLFNRYRFWAGGRA